MTAVKQGKKELDEITQIIKREDNTVTTENSRAKDVFTTAKGELAKAQEDEEKLRDPKQRDQKAQLRLRKDYLIAVVGYLL